LVGQNDMRTFAPSETTRTITIRVKGGSKEEANETFYLDLFDNRSNSWLTKSRGQCMSLNDDWSLGFE
jgi:hypothetical protein